MPRPVPTPLYHFTSIHHLDSIVERGLHCDNGAVAGLLAVEVGNRGVSKSGAGAEQCRWARVAWSRTTSRSTSRRVARCSTPSQWATCRSTPTAWTAGVPRHDCRPAGRARTTDAVH